MSNLQPFLRKGSTIFLLTITPFFLTGCGLRSGQEVTSQAKQTLTYWHVKQPGDEKVFDKLITTYENDTPTISIETRLFEATDDYETAVINALAAGKGPDIWEIRDDELARHKDKLAGFVFPSKGELEIFKKTYAKVIADQMILDGTLYGMPIAIDPLVLYMNVDHMKQAGIEKPPKSWEELAADAKLTTLRVDEAIVRPGFAMGMASNLDRASQILQLVMMQLGVQMVDPAHKQAAFDLFVQDPDSGEYRYLGQEALAFFASFADPQSAYQSWDANQPYSTQAFASGNLSMMINYLSLYPQMKLLNSKLNYSVSGVPQRDLKKIPVGDTPAEISKEVQLAKYRSLVVSKSPARLTKEQRAAREKLAWQFIQYSTSNIDITSVYAKQTSQIPPQIYANASVSQDSQNETITAIINPNTTNWYKGPSPRIVDQIFGQMIKGATEAGQPIATILAEASAAITGILR